MEFKFISSFILINLLFIPFNLEVKFKISSHIFVFRWPVFISSTIYHCNYNSDHFCSQKQKIPAIVLWDPSPCSCLLVVESW